MALCMIETDKLKRCKALKTQALQLDNSIDFTPLCDIYVIWVMLTVLLYLVYLFQASLL